MELNMEVVQTAKGFKEMYMVCASSIYGCVNVDCDKNSVHYVEGTYGTSTAYQKNCPLKNIPYYHERCTINNGFTMTKEMVDEYLDYIDMVLDISVAANS